MLTLGRKKNRLETIECVEFTRSQDSIRVDRDTNTIHGVKLLGLNSANNREYQDFALADGKGLYEGADVYFNHPKNPTDSRGYGDKFGKVCNVVHRPGDGLYGDLLFNPKHNLAEQALWDAEHSPESLGLSPNHQVKARNGPGGKKIIEAINRVRSVDLVANPATTGSLFEHKETTMATLTELVNKATPHASKVLNILEENGIETTAPIDVLGEMAPAEAVEDALAQTALAIFKDDSISPEETGAKVAELNAIVVDVKAKTEPGAAVEPEADPEADPPAEDHPSDPPAEEEEEATEARIEKAISPLVKSVHTLMRRDQARSVLESQRIPVNSDNLQDLVECVSESAMESVISGWSGKRRGLRQPIVPTSAIKTSAVPTDPKELRSRYASK